MTSMVAFTNSLKKSSPFAIAMPVQLLTRSPMKPTEYLKNPAILAAIHRSKMTYTAYEDRKLHSDYVGFSPSKDLVPDDGLVYRVMTWEHIPGFVAAPVGAKKIKESRAAGGAGKIQINFPPFKHYVREDGVVREVARSHWVGDIASGEFSQTHGRHTDALGRIYQLLVTRYGTRYNWRNYSFNEEMQGQAIVQLCQVGLSFNESKGNNPFAYYTTIVDNCFKVILRRERKQADIRDEHLLMAGVMPSSRTWAGDLGKYEYVPSEPAGQPPTA